MRRPMRRKQPRMVCLGDMMLDIVVHAGATIETGTDVQATIRFRLGGSAANAARVFAGLGGEAVFIGAVGDDTLAGRLTAALRATRVIVHAVKLPGLTPRLVAIIAPDGQRSFITDRGIADDLAPTTLRRQWLSRTAVLHLPAYSLLHRPFSEAALEAEALVRRIGVLVSVDLASRRPLVAAGRARAWEAVRAVKPDVLFGNGDEVSALVGRRGERALLELARVVVVKEGASGCHVIWAENRREPFEIEVATRAVATTDTTGAGDAFDAGFLYSLISSGYIPGGSRYGAVVRRAALAGHRAAARWLTSPRPELVL